MTTLFRLLLMGALSSVVCRLGVLPRQMVSKLLGPLPRIRYDDICRIDSVRQSYALTAAHGLAGTNVSSGIVILVGSQFVSCFSIAQPTTAILRARAMAAFFLRVL